MSAAQDDRTWTASLISPTDDSLDPRRPIRFRRNFTAHATTRATVAITACGVYRAFCNGVEIVDHVLAPGWTSYRHRHHVQTFDLTQVMRGGTNTLAIEVAEGWWRGRLGWGEGVRAIYGNTIGAFAQLDLADDGSTRTVVTDGSWKWAPSATLTASLYDGECYDQRLDDEWMSADYDDEAWASVRVAEFDSSTLCLQTAPPVRRIEDLTPKRITTLPSDRMLVDFGQNASGRLSVRVPPEGGHTITFRHAEVLEDGELSTRPLRNAAATDVIHTSGAGGVWEPAFTLHGFRYVEVDGWPGDLGIDDLRMVICHSDLPEIGGFSSSDERLNRLHDNIRWSAKSNFVSIPTDCPQRDERVGWTGDIQVFAPTASFLFDCYDWLWSWLRDLAAEQSAGEGRVPVVVPALAGLIPNGLAAAGWSDAAVIVPWVLYQRFGDAAVLDDQFDSMKDWVDASSNMSDPDGIWRGFQFGDWLDPTSPPGNPALGRTDPHLVATAYRARSARLVSETAAVLGRDADAARYRTLADSVRTSFRHEFVTPSGRLVSDSPTAHALAMGFHLVEGTERERAGRRLIELVEADDFRIGTGFLGTPLICDALADAGAPDHAFRLLFQTECPSWLYPVTMGATTVWERWDSMLPDGSINPGEMTSFNHYAFGAVADFLHRRVAGLAPAAPGYRELEVRPIVGGGLRHARAFHRTPHGEASVEWTRDHTDFDLRLQVPDGCSAVVHLPDGTDPVNAGRGHHHFSCAVRSPEDDPLD